MRILLTHVQALALHLLDVPIALSVSFLIGRHDERPPLSIPIIAFDGRRDNTIDRGNMRQWRRYTSSRFRMVSVDGDHYFVSKLYQQVCFPRASFCQPALP